MFLILDMSCHHIGYIKGLLITMIIGFHLENVYNVAHYYMVEYLRKKKKQINEVIEKVSIEIDDEIKDKPNKTK